MMVALAACVAIEKKFLRCESKVQLISSGIVLAAVTSAGLWY